MRAHLTLTLTLTFRVTFFAMRIQWARVGKWGSSKKLLYNKYYLDLRSVDSTCLYLFRALYNRNANNYT